MTTTQLTPAQHAILAKAINTSGGKIEWFCGGRFIRRRRGRRGSRGDGSGRRRGRRGAQRSLRIARGRLDRRLRHDDLGLRPEPQRPLAR